MPVDLYSKGRKYHPEHPDRAAPQGYLWSPDGLLKKTSIPRSKQGYDRAPWVEPLTNAARQLWPHMKGLNFQHPQIPSQLADLTSLDQPWPGSIPNRDSWPSKGDNRILDSVVQDNYKTQTVMGTNDPTYNWKPKTYKNWWGGETQINDFLRDAALLAIPGGVIKGAGHLKNIKQVEGLRNFLQNLSGTKIVDAKDIIKESYRLLPASAHRIGKKATSQSYHGLKIGGIATDAAMGLLGNLATPLSYVSKYAPYINKIGLAKTLNKVAFEPIHRSLVGSKVMELGGSEKGLGDLAGTINRKVKLPLYSEEELPF